jgi:DNA-binding PadR family transcriptional regulator
VRDASDAALPATPAEWPPIPPTPIGRQVLVMRNQTSRDVLRTLVWHGPKGRSWLRPRFGELENVLAYLRRLGLIEKTPPLREGRYQATTAGRSLVREWQIEEIEEVSRHARGVSPRHRLRGN